MSQSIPFALPADVARADGDVLVSSEGLVSSEDLRRGGGRHQSPARCLSSTFRKYTHSEPRFRVQLAEDGSQQIDLARALVLGDLGRGEAVTKVSCQES